MTIFLFCAIGAWSLTDSTKSITPQKFLTGTDVVITEIMADPEPAAGLPSIEYCEIYNRGSVAVDLTGWSFYDGVNRALPSVIIYPGEYVIICNDDDTASFSGFGKCAEVSSLSLTNSGEKISLRNPAGIAMDSVIFSDSWLGSTYKKDGGWSLEKIDPGFICPVSYNWSVSIDPSGGTPGAVNSVNGILEDTNAPVLLRGYCTDSVSVVLVFNEPLDPVNALMVQNYEMLPDVSPVYAAFADENFQRVLLTFPTPILQSIIKTIHVRHITDCPGNEIASHATTRIGIADTSTSSGIVINEILFNPFDGGDDFVELFHSGKGILNLNEYKISNVDNETGLINESEKIIGETWLMFPGDYMILTENTQAVSGQYATSFPHNFIELSKLPSMNVDEGTVIISRNEKIIDNFHYLDSYHFELLQDVKGISLEKINPAYPGSDPFSWHSAAESFGYATPGLQNSQYAEINTASNSISLTPEIFSPDNDGYDDVLNITMKSDKAGYIANIQIYSSQGIIVNNYPGNKLLATNDTFTWDGIISGNTRAPAGIYIAYIQIHHLNGDLKNYRKPFVLAVKP